MNPNSMYEEDQKKPSREKYWSECDIEMRVERLRNAIHRLQRDVSMLMKFMRYLQSHSHTADGSVVIPMFMKDEPQINYQDVPIKRNENESYL